MKNTTQCIDFLGIRSAVYHRTKNYKEAFRLATLYAASPELLEACKQAISNTNNINWDLMASAIAKAEGQ